MRRVVPVLVAAVSLSMVAAPTRSAELPFNAELGQGSVTLLVSRAVIQVDRSTGCEPTLAAGVEGDDGPSAPRLDLDRGGGGLEIRRPPAEDGAQLPLLRMELTLDPAQALHIEGEDLRITVADASPALGESDGGRPVEASSKADEAEPEPAASAGTASVQLSVRGSQVGLLRTGAAAITGADSSVSAAGCRGDLTIDLEYGYAEVGDHQGSVNLGGSRNEYRLRDHAGRLTAELEGGNLSVAGGGGVLNVTLEEAGLQLQAWEGSGSITGTFSSVEVRESGGGQLVLTGQSVDARMEGWDGPVVGRLAGGSLGGSGWSGGAKLTLEDAVLELDDVTGEITLTLLDRSRARLSQVSGTLTVDERDGSELEVDGVEKVSVAASDSLVWLRGAEKVQKLELDRCDAELDLTGLSSRNPSISLKGTTTAEVLLESPCMVRVDGPDAALASGVILSGCELFSAQHRRSRRHRVSLEGEQAMTLTAKLDEQAALTVRGRP